MLHTVALPPVYSLYTLPFVAFLVVDAEFRRWSVVSQYELFPKPEWLQHADTPRWLRRPPSRRKAVERGGTL